MKSDRSTHTACPTYLLWAELLKKLESPPVGRFDFAGHVDRSTEVVGQNDCPNCNRNFGATNCDRF